MTCSIFLPPFSEVVIPQCPRTKLVYTHKISILVYPFVCSQVPYILRAFMSFILRSSIETNLLCHSRNSIQKDKSSEWHQRKKAFYYCTKKISNSMYVLNRPMHPNPKYKCSWHFKNVTTTVFYISWHYNELFPDLNSSNVVLSEDQYNWTNSIPFKMAFKWRKRHLTVEYDFPLPR